MAAFGAARIVNLGAHPVTMFRMATPAQRATATTPAMAPTYERVAALDVPVDARTGVLVLTGAVDGGARMPTSLATAAAEWPLAHAHQFAHLAFRERTPGAAPREVHSRAGCLAADFLAAATGESVDGVDFRGTVFVTNALVMNWMLARRGHDALVTTLLSEFLFVGPGTDGDAGVRDAAGSVIGTTQLVAYNYALLRS